MKRNFVTRKGKFDAGHRVMHERFKCFNLHGHEYHYELTFSYLSQAHLGYAIDFKEIKRIACSWIDDAFDHGFIANPRDEVIIEACKKIKSKLYIMHLIDKEGFCNPSAENIAKEMFFAVSRLLDEKTEDGQEEYNLQLEMVRLYETVNCFVECCGLTTGEQLKFIDCGYSDEVDHYKEMKGTVEYDDRKVSKSKADMH